MLWNDLFRCGIPHIDAQHKALFEHIEHLGAMSGDVSRIPVTIEFLERYTSEHFADEESLHEQTDYQRKIEHRRQHHDFVREVRKLKSEYESMGHNLTTLMEMNRALVRWLKTHILDSDKHFSIFFHTLPETTVRALRLPHRPWIPESSQSFYYEAMGIRPGAPPPGAAASGSGAAHMLGSLWNDSLLCGIPAIDAQHRELFRQLDILRDRGSRDSVPRVLRFLADYVVKHFNDEESLHLASRYPKAVVHRELHAEFVAVFTNLKAKYDDSKGAPAVVAEVSQVVYDWLKEHVMKIDKEFALYYLARQDETAGPAP